MLKVGHFPIRAEFRIKTYLFIKKFAKNVLKISAFLFFQ